LGNGPARRLLHDCTRSSRGCAAPLVSSQSCTSARDPRRLLSLKLSRGTATAPKRHRRVARLQSVCTPASAAAIELPHLTLGTRCRWRRALAIASAPKPVAGARGVSTIAFRPSRVCDRRRKRRPRCPLLCETGTPIGASADQRPVAAFRRDRASRGSAVRRARKSSRAPSRLFLVGGDRRLGPCIRRSR
jgi:hypothetical protein